MDMCKCRIHEFEGYVFGALCKGLVYHKRNLKLLIKYFQIFKNLKIDEEALMKKYVACLQSRN